MKPQTISVVGGQGRMGALMARLFTKAGHHVAIFDAKAGPIDWESAAAAPVILLAVPIPAIDRVMRRLGPHTREDGVIIDIASIKESPVQSMLQHHRGEVIGSHPLFGPETPSLEGQTIFVYPARSTRWIEWFRSFLTDQGGRVVEIEPARHDRLMSIVQVLRHLLLFCFGRSLMRLDFDLKGDLPLSGPWFSGLVDMLGRQVRQEPGLYADLTRHNPATSHVLEEFMNAAGEIAASFGPGDRNKIIGLVNEVSSYLEPASGIPGLPIKSVDKSVLIEPEPPAEPG